MDNLVFSRQSGFTYGPADTPIERGLVFRLQNQPRDQQLVGLGYFTLLPDDYQPVKCLGCGREFADEMYRNQHARRAQHPAVDLDVGPLKQLRGSLQTPDPDGEGDWGIEREGAPPPTRTEETGTGHPAAQRRGPGGQQRAREVIRLG